jgi:hypothetical protein
VHKKTLVVFEFAHPATTDNVGTRENFKLWRELNFAVRRELFARRRVYT